MKFKDSTDCEWTWPKFTTRKLNELREVCGVDLRGLLGNNEQEVGLALLNDEKLIDIFCFLCKSQIDGRAITRAEIEERWDGDTNVAARESLIERFFRHCLSAKATELLMAKRRSDGLTSNS